MFNFFVVNGYPRSGKTFFGELVGEAIGNRGCHFAHLSSITPIKILLRPQELWDPRDIDTSLWAELEELKRTITKFDWDGETKDEYWRATMFDLKHALTEKKPDFIHHWVYTRAQQLPEPRVIFVDIREPHNILAFEDYCLRQPGEHNLRKILVESDVVEHPDNSADRNIDLGLCDFRVLNYRLGKDPSESIALLKAEVVRFIDTELSFLANEPESR